MANIVIMSIRFNLDKDDDRRLFESLLKQLNKTDQSRNEFIKQLLLDCLSGCSLAGGSAVRPSKKRQQRRSEEKLSGQPVLGVSGPESISEASRGTQSKSGDSQASTESAPNHGDDSKELDVATAALVASFVS